MMTIAIAMVMMVSMVTPFKSAQGDPALSPKRGGYVFPKSWGCPSVGFTVPIITGDYAYPDGRCR